MIQEKEKENRTKSNLKPTAQMVPQDIWSEGKANPFESAKTPWDIGALGSGSDTSD